MRRCLRYVPLAWSEDTQRHSKNGCPQDMYSPVGFYAHKSYAPALVSCFLHGTDRFPPFHYIKSSLELAFKQSTSMPMIPEGILEEVSTEATSARGKTLETSYGNSISSCASWRLILTPSTIRGPSWIATYFMITWAIFRTSVYSDMVPNRRIYATLQVWLLQLNFDNSHTIESRDISPAVVK